MKHGKSWLEISGEHLRHNYDVLRHAAEVRGVHIPVLAVVKADAYGHNAAVCAPVLAKAGAPWLGVTDAEEGARVREALLRHNAGEPGVLVMCGLLPEDAELIVRNRLTPVVWNGDQLRWVERAAEGTDTVEVHVEIDTGMSRQGVIEGEALERLLDALAELPRVRVSGVMTHFASAEIAGSLLTALQRGRFETAMAQIGARGLRPEWLHVGNTSTVDEGSSVPWLVGLAGKHGARAMLRSGLALYGYSLPLEGASSAMRERLEPVATWKARVAAVEEISAGATVGYNATFSAVRPMRLALLPVGYADGLRRELSATNARPGGWVMVRGQRAPVVGRISMNLTTVDVSEIPGVEVGDAVTLLGDGISADQHARLAGTIAYEILCGLRAPAELMA